MRTASGMTFVHAWQTESHSTGYSASRSAGYVGVARRATQSSHSVPGTIFEIFQLLRLTST
jgi:hypothetical protein